jgi:hypothetical protein
MPLSEKDRERLSNLLAMFSSSFDGEVVNAARAAERLVKARGETWESVIVPPGTSDQSKHKKPNQQEQDRPKQRRSPFQDEIDECQKKKGFLTPWEREFLDSISERFSLSDKQHAILNRIKDKLRGFKDMDW